eukprot:3941974-Rhodomonas_salina.6
MKTGSILLSYVGQYLVPLRGVYSLSLRLRYAPVPAYEPATTKLVLIARVRLYQGNPRRCTMEFWWYTSLCA